MNEHIAIVAFFLILALASCGPYSGPACDSCVGPYDVTLTSHQKALGLRQ